MALRPLLFSAVVGIAAALGVSYSPAAQAEGSFSVRIGSPAPYYGSHYGDGRYDGRYDRRYDRRDAYYGGYGRHHRPGYALVPGHWAHTHRGRIWVPAQYVRMQGHYGYRPTHRLDLRPLPGAFYRERGGKVYPHRGW